MKCHTGAKRTIIYRIIPTLSLITYYLTLKWPRYFYSRWCPRGGDPRDPTVENHFSSRILQCNLPHICMDYKKLQFCKKKKIKNWKCCTVSKWRPNNRFLFRVISILAKIWKTAFPKEFFNEIWLKVGEHEYIYITEIAFWKKKYSVLNWRPKQFVLKLRNNANLC